MVTKLRTDYKEKIINSLYKSLNCTNIHQVPKLIKIKVNRGLGLAAQNKEQIVKAIIELRDNYDSFQDSVQKFSKNFNGDGAENTASIVSEILEGKK